MSARTYSAELETRQRSLRDLIDNDGAGSWVIHADPLERDNGDGTKSVSIGFPVLVLTGWVADGELVAKRIAAILTEAKL